MERELHMTLRVGLSAGDHSEIGVSLSISRSPPLRRVADIKRFSTKLEPVTFREREVLEEREVSVAGVICPPQLDN